MLFLKQFLSKSQNNCCSASNSTHTCELDLQEDILPWDILSYALDTPHLLPWPIPNWNGPRLAIIQTLDISHAYGDEEAACPTRSHAPHTFIQSCNRSFFVAYSENKRDSARNL
mmetsp:Transcript_39574/g.80739  ORF Transcript_39574/g.80739 Transcript_39574/m.80739 type:complete len:114 (+) Transcript_39574:53-394(+)